MVSVYNPREVVVIVGGEQIEGISVDDGIQIAREEESFFMDMDMRGRAYRTTNPNRSGTITLNVYESSPSSTLLLNKLKKAEQDERQGIFNVEVKSVSTGKVFVSSAAWIQGLPEHSYVGGETQTQEWVISVERLDFDWSSIEPVRGDVEGNN